MNRTGIRLIILLLVSVLATGARAADSRSFYFFPGRTVDINRAQQGDLLVIGADVTITAPVRGNLSVLGGNVTIQHETVDGDVVVIAGQLTVADGAKVTGSQVELAGGLRHNRTATLVLSMLFWLLTIGIGAYFFPEHLQENAFELADDFVRAVLLGIYATGILVLLALISFVLVQVVVGIFLTMAVLIFGATLYLFSVLTMFYFLGELLWKRLFNMPLPGLAYLGTGLIIYELMAWLGLLGFVTTTVLLLGAVGATLLSRFGTFKPWFGRPRYWGSH